MKNDIANLIVEKTYNKETGLPFPQKLIIQVLNDIHFDAKDDKLAKMQALAAIKVIQDRNIIPIERKYMQIQITPKSTTEDYEILLVALIKYLEDNKVVFVKKQLEPINSFVILFNILPHIYRDLVMIYEKSIRLVL